MKSIMHGRFIEFGVDPGDRLLRCEFDDGAAPPADWVALVVAEETGPATSTEDLGKEGTPEELLAWVATLPKALCASGEVDGANGNYRAWAAVDPETRRGYVECWINADSEWPVGRYLS